MSGRQGTGHWLLYIRVEGAGASVGGNYRSLVRVIIGLDMAGHCLNLNVYWPCVRGGFDLVVCHGDIR
jgi:hypothetical protein